jgi:phosphopantothenoylcysteine decarboxylase/phosphopantothenate--cysteine ligase
MPEQNPDSTINRRKVALGVSGGIAAYKAVEVLRGLQRAGCEVRVAMTRHACEFVTPLTFRALSGSQVIVDDYAADNPDPIAHINFSQSIDLLVIAPATANIIAKFANGIADDFLSSTYLACTAPVLIAPAMNTTMWQHPATRRNLETLRHDGIMILDPDSGEMACRTIGPGRLSEPDIIVKAALDALRPHSEASMDLAGERVLITAGATREEIDPVRFISNRSSGLMGFALAEAARDQGADVLVVAGTTTASAPTGVRIVRVGSADEMAAAVMQEISNISIFIGAAAVADYRPVKRAAEKIKKKDLSFSLTLERTPDVLALVAAERKPGMIVVGFAAETNEVEANALKKLESKGLDLIVANDVTKEGAGFDTSTNIVSIFSRNSGTPVHLTRMSKLDIAKHVLDEIVKLRRAAWNDVVAV